MTAKNRTFNLMEHTKEKVVKAPSDTLKVAPQAAALAEKVTLDFSSCEKLRVLDLVNLNLSRMEAIHFPPDVDIFRCMMTTFPKDFVVDLRESERLTALNLNFAKNIKDVIVSNKIPAAQLHKIAENLPEGVVIHRENGEEAYKGKPFNKYFPVERASSKTAVAELKAKAEFLDKLHER